MSLYSHKLLVDIAAEIEVSKCFVHKILNIIHPFQNLFWVLKRSVTRSTYSRTSMARTGLGPWKLVLAKGSSSHSGWIMLKMTGRDHDHSSSQPR